MASFVEFATLKVNDQSSAALKKINDNVKKLLATAKQLQGLRGGTLGFNTSRLAAAEAQVRRLNSELRSLRSAAGSIRLNVNASGLNQASRQIERLRAQARRPITLRTVAGAAAAYGVGQKVIEKGKQGVRDVDIGESGLDLKELSDARRKYVDTLISQTGREQAGRVGGAMWNRGQIAQEMNEMLGVVKIGASTGEADFEKRANAAKFLADQNLELAATFVKLGMSQEAARETSTKFGKAMEQQGKIFDAAGNLNLDVARQEYDNIRKLIPAIGKEATGENYLALMKFLRASKFSLEPEAVASAMFKFEEMGTGAAVGLNQFIKNLSGSAKPAQLAEMARLGIVPTKEVTSGRVGRQKTKSVAADMSEEDARLLRTSPQRFTNERIIPALLRDLVKQGLTQEQAEARLNDPAYVATQMGKLFSDRTAQEMATSMVLLRAENEQALRDYRSRKGTVESQRDATKHSVLGASTAVGNQLAGVIGEGVRAAAPILVPALNLMSEGMREFGDTVAKARMGDKEAQQKIAEGTVAAAAFGLPTVKMASQVMSQMATLAGPLGMAAGMTAAADPTASPMVKSLALAGVSLNAAGMQLQGVATAMGALAMLQGGEGLLGMLKKLNTPIVGDLLRIGAFLYELDKNRPKPEAPTEEDELAKESKIASDRLAAAEAERSRIQADLDRKRGDDAAMKRRDGKRGKVKLPPKEAEERRQAQDRVTSLDAEIAAKKRELAEIEERRQYGPPAPPALGMPKGWVPPKDVEINDPEIKLPPGTKFVPGKGWGLMTPQPSTEVGDRRRTVSEEPEEPKPRHPLFRPKRTEDTAKNEAEAKAAREKADAEERAAAARKKGAAIKAEPEAKPEEEAKPPALTGITAPGITAEGQAETARAISTASASLAGTSTLFAAAFSTGAQQIAAAGQTAAAAIAAGASSAGAAYGAAAAAAIQAAAANVNINVNTKGGGADTGSQKAASGPNNG